MSHIADQHNLLYHPSGEPCPDGCTQQPVWCSCPSPASAGYRKAGWIICLLCKRPVGGIS